MMRIHVKRTIPKKMRFSLWDLYMGFICAFPITTVILDESIVNKLLFAAVFALQLCLLLSRPIKKNTLWELVLLAFSYFFTLFSTTFPVYNINLLIYFPFCIMYCFFMRDQHSVVKDWFCENYGFVHAVVIIWSGIVGISIFLPSCYHIREGGSFYFGSFCGSIFRLGPSAIFIQTLVILMQILYKKRNAILYMVIPMYCFFMGSSRTYFVVGLCLFVVSWFVFCRSKLVFWGTAFWLLVGALSLVGVSALGNKIAHTLDETRYGDFWFRITSSRSFIWTENLNAWLKTDTLKKILGNGFGFSYLVTGHWAHNDFVEILCSSGVLGLIIYIASISSLRKRICGKVKMPLYMMLCIFMIWFFNACFNMFYVYFCPMLSYPFLLIAIETYFKRE